MVSGKSVSTIEPTTAPMALVDPPITQATRICSIRPKPKSPGVMKKLECA